MENLTFDSMSLSQEILNAVSDMGFTKPSPIQAQAIPYILEKRDIIGQAQTGTGKTAAFAIPALENIDTKQKNIQVLVLCPTRELALQVSLEFKKLAKYKENIFATAIYGGESIERQINQLKRGVHVVIGTPGRVIDHIERGTLKLGGVHTIILDEADEMLNMGFKEDIETILEELPEERQTVLFSATMPAPIMELAKRYQNNPHLVKVVSQQLTGQSIEQYYFPVKSDNKMELMTRLIEFHQLKSMLVFCNTKQKAADVAEELIERGFTAEALHGDLAQNQRNNVMGKFRNGRVDILVATDVAARGIDVDDVEAVFNYDTPLDPEYYVHRIGRTGRAGKSGLSFTFVSGKDAYRLRDIERYAKVKINQGVIPGKKDILQARENKFIEKIKSEINKGELQQFDALIARLTAEGLELKEITGALLNIYSGISYQTVQSKDIEFTENRKDYDRERDKSDNRTNGFQKGKNPKMVRLFMNLGKKQKIGKGDIVGAISGETGIKGANLGTIDMYDKFSFIEVPKSDADKIIQIMGKSKIKGNKVNFEFAN